MEGEFVDCGSRALDALESRPFNANVTDMRMPGMKWVESPESRLQPGTLTCYVSSFPGIPNWRPKSDRHELRITYFSKPCFLRSLKVALQSVLVPARTAP